MLPNNPTPQTSYEYGYEVARDGTADDTVDGTADDTMYDTVHGNADGTVDVTARGSSSSSYLLLITSCSNALVVWSLAHQTLYALACCIGNSVAVIVQGRW